MDSNTFSYDKNKFTQKFQIPCIDLESIVKDYLEDNLRYKDRTLEYWGNISQDVNRSISFWRWEWYSFNKLNKEKREVIWREDLLDNLLLKPYHTCIETDGFKLFFLPLDRSCVHSDRYINFYISSLRSNMYFLTWSPISKSEVLFVCSFLSNSILHFY